uniref:Gibberellin-regulated protein 9 n=1 Tax=Rhizophora mucronata TaxID=61149 RepID=A0A2P2J6P5_RHIMU
MKLFSLFLILILLLQVVAGHQLLGNNANLPETIRDRSAKVAIDKKHFPKKINCGLACSKRCSKSSRKNVCHRACNACCFRCHCVPPGTYGNKSACPCYASLRTHGNKPKCP